MMYEITENRSNTITTRDQLRMIYSVMGGLLTNIDDIWVTCDESIWWGCRYNLGDTGANYFMIRNSEGLSWKFNEGTALMNEGKYIEKTLRETFNLPK